VSVEELLLRVRVNDYDVALGRVGYDCIKIFAPGAKRKEE